MRGAYLLLLHLPSFSSINIGKLGKVKFNKGYYIYVGSAMNSLLGRVNYHLKKDKKNHWHIDYFTQKAKIVDVLMFKNRKECALAKKMSGDSILNFGCTDCNCDSHLFYFKEKPTIFSRLP